MKQPLISVIINCFNGEKYLSETIKSVIGQTYENWELIFWDNQSTDNSREIFEKFDDNRLNYFYADSHTTLGQARNLAIAKSKGEWIGFLDTDDLWHKTKLEKQTSIINTNHEIGFVYGQAEIIYSGIRKKNKINNEKLPEGNIFEELLKDNFIYYVSALINKDKLSRIPKIPDTFNQVEDYYIFLHLSKFYEVKALQEICCSYRIHDNNLSRNMPVEGATESLELVRSFLPDVRAQDAIGYKLSSLAIAQIREREYVKAFLSLLKGGFTKFIKRFILHIFK